jgi:hypothetical protein
MEPFPVAHSIVGAVAHFEAGANTCEPHDIEGLFCGQAQ